MPEAIHMKALEYYKDYLITGGMPAVVANSINDYSGVVENYVACQLVQLGGKSNRYHIINKTKGILS